jgi:hypothetical protein
MQKNRYKLRFTIVTTSLLFSLAITIFGYYLTYLATINLDMKHFILTWSFKDLLPYFVYLAMLLGLFSGRAVEYLEKHDVTVKPSELFYNIIFAPRFWIALLGSPITYWAIWYSVNSFSDPLVMLVVSYQNGFFWQGVTRAFPRESGK